MPASAMEVGVSGSEGSGFCTFDRRPITNKMIAVYFNKSRLVHAKQISVFINFTLSDLIVVKLPETEL